MHTPHNDKQDTTDGSQWSLMKSPSARSLALAGLLSLVGNSAKGAEVDGGDAPTNGQAVAVDPTVEDVSLEKVVFDRSIIDVHVHATTCEFPGSEPNKNAAPSATEALSKAPAFFLAPILDSEMEKGGVGIAFLMGRITTEIDLKDPLGVSKSLAIGKHSKNEVKVIGAADPLKSNADGYMDAVRKQLDALGNEIVAFKCYLGYVGSPLDPGYQPYYELAKEYDLPVIFHTGTTSTSRSLLKDCNPRLIDIIAAQNPDMKIVIAHAGHPSFMDAAQVAFKNKNVWLEVSGMSDLPPERLATFLAAEELPDAMPGFPVADLEEALVFLDKWDKVIYGSDFPLATFKQYRELMERVIPAEHHEKVFLRNAEELFKVKVDVTVPRTAKK